MHNVPKRLKERADHEKAVKTPHGRHRGASAAPVSIALDRLRTFLVLCRSSLSLGSSVNAESGGVK
jgi:hypothetical protein